MSNSKAETVLQPFVVWHSVIERDPQVKPVRSLESIAEEINVDDTTVVPKRSNELPRHYRLTECVFSGVVRLGNRWLTDGGEPVVKTIFDLPDYSSRTSCSSVPIPSISISIVSPSSSGPTP